MMQKTSTETLLRVCTPIWCAWSASIALYIGDCAGNVKFDAFGIEKYRFIHMNPSENPQSPGAQIEHKADKSSRYLHAGYGGPLPILDGPKKCPKSPLLCYLMHASTDLFEGLGSYSSALPPNLTMSGCFNVVNDFSHCNSTSMLVPITGCQWQRTAVATMFRVSMQ